MIAAYGISRTRDKKGEIIKQTTLPWVNCIHRKVGGGWKTMEVLILEVYMKHYRIRKLTPTECLRLMGVSNVYIRKMRASGISDTQLYKMAGNSIVVPVLEGIFRNIEFTEKPLRVFEAFSGYGSQSMALRNIGVDHEVVGISEIDKYAIMAYNATHAPTKNYGDIANIDWSCAPDFDLFTYSFPCTDISNAGAQAGFEEGSGTRSSLLWECRKAITAKHPKYLLMENVKPIVGKKFRPWFNKWQEFLTVEGYTNFVRVLNAKDYGVPQNRERCFMVSILGEAWYDFPASVSFTANLKDYLEDAVDEKYYLDQKRVDAFFAQLSQEDKEALAGLRAFNTEDDGSSRTIKAQYYKNGFVNFFMRGDRGATGVLEAYDDEND